MNKPNKGCRVARKGSDEECRGKTETGENLWHLPLTPLESDDAVTYIFMREYTGTYIHAYIHCHAGFKMLQDDSLSNDITCDIRNLRCLLNSHCAIVGMN